MIRRVTGLALALSLAAAEASAQQDAGPSPPAAEWVIPPGMETAALRMFNGRFVGGRCRLDGVSLDHVRIVARYRCARVAEAVVIEGRHLSEARPGATATGSFALAVTSGVDAPAALLAEVATQVRAGEGDWHWSHVEVRPTRRGDVPVAIGLPADADGGALRAGDSDGGTRPPADGSASSEANPAGPGQLPPAQRARYQLGFEAYRSRRYGEAIGIFTALARENTCCGVLGMVVASIASTAPTAADAARAASEADAAASDPLKQFIAGVTAHYAAHNNGRSREEKLSLYGRCITYLEGVRTPYPEEPRLFISLAVSHFRRGRQAEAQRFIERAVELGSNDPDAYYCRAEVYQRVNPQRAIADIDTYIAMATRFAAQGAVLDPGKTERVRALRAHLVAVSRGEAQPRELFDPLNEHRQGQPGRTNERGWDHSNRANELVTTTGQQRRRSGFGLVVFGAVTAGLWWWWSRRKGGGAGPP